MKRIMLFWVPVIVAVSMIGCSNDYESPTFGGYNTLVKPSNFVATYDKASDKFIITWEMSDTSSVVNYKVAFSDSSVFGYGYNAEVKTDTLACTYSILSANLFNRMVRTPSDSLVVYFTVSPVYHNGTFNQFTGPRADIDTALIYTKVASKR